MGSSINDVTVLGGESNIFQRQNYAFGIKRVTMGNGGQKLSKIAYGNVIYRRLP